MNSRMPLFLLLLVWSQTSSAMRTVVWDRTVISVSLIVGVEQMVHFEGPATVGVPESLISQDMFRHLFAGDTAYWKAMRPFESQRIKVRLDNTGDYLLFDVSARTLEKPPRRVEALNVVVQRESSQTARPEQTTATALAATDDTDATFFDLLRYAIQSDYSPPRVIAALDGVREIENDVWQQLNTLYRHPDGPNIDLFAQRQWTVNGWHVTAIEIHNRRDYPITIDPSHLQHTARRVVNGVGNPFIAAAMIKRDLTAHRGTQDRTRVYVVTDKPFSAVLQW